MGLLAPWFLAGAAALAVPLYLHLLRRHTIDSAAVQLADVFRAAHAKLDQASPPALSAAARAAAQPARAAGARLRRARSSIAPPSAPPATSSCCWSSTIPSACARARAWPTRSARPQSVLASRNPAERAQVMALGSQLQVLTQPTQDAGTLTRRRRAASSPATPAASFGELARALRSAARERVRTRSSCISSATCRSPTCRRISPTPSSPPTSRSSCIRW